MTNGFDEMILNMTDTTPEPEDYTGEDGLLYCGKCHKPKEGYFPKETAAWLALSDPAASFSDPFHQPFSEYILTFPSSGSST